MSTPKIYVACLAAYNNGKLHGQWIDATSPDEITEQVRAMLAASPEPDAEEWAIHDYEGFEGIRLSEYASFETVCELADFIEEHGELGAKVLENFGDNIGEAKQALEDCYSGEYSSLAEFAQEITEGQGEIPSHLEYYIDWEKMGRDLELGGDVFTIELGFNEVHVFWSR